MKTSTVPSVTARSWPDRVSGSCALRARSAGIGGGEFALMDHGTHGIVEYEDAGGEGIFERSLARAIQRKVLKVTTEGRKKRAVQAGIDASWG